MKNISAVGGESETEIFSVGFDSRKAHKGSLFVCLKGALKDGHLFAESAYENGCRAFLCERKLDLPPDAECIVVEDTRAALPYVSANFYGHPANKLHIIGITGTKGKTTTALLTASILNASGLNCAYIGSNGVIINGEQTATANTTPESLFLHKYFDLMVKGNVKYAVLEVSSQALSHHRVDGIPFETVAFTNLSEDHIGEAEHPTFEHYKESKKRLFTEYNAKYAVYNADDAESEFMLEKFGGERFSYGIDKNADLTAENIEKFRSPSALGVAFDCIKRGRKIKTSLLSPGYFSVYNALCAISICERYGVSPDFSATVLSRTTVQGRFEIVEGLRDRTFIIDYSHNGVSLEAALKTLTEYEHKRIICLFGSVGGRTQCRREELAHAASKYADYIIVTSDNPDFEEPLQICREIAENISGAEYEIIVNRADAIKRAIEMSESGDIVLFAGKGHETYQLVCGRKMPFCEREIIKDICKSYIKA